MATTHLNRASAPADHETAPLPAPAADALSRLEASPLPVGPSTMAAQLLKSRVRAAELADLGDAGFELSPLEWDDLAHAEDLMAGTRAILAEADMLHLVGDPADVIAAAIEGLESGSVAPFDGYDARAIAETLRTQAAAGRLSEAAAYLTAQRLIGGAS